MVKFELFCESILFVYQFDIKENRKKSFELLRKSSLHPFINSGQTCSQISKKMKRKTLKKVLNESVLYFPISHAHQ